VKKLILRRRFFLAAAIICVAALTASITLRFSYWNYCMVFAMMGGTLAATLSYIAHKNFKSARLIVENTILLIQPAVLQERDGGYEDEDNLRETFGMVVSVFGILLGNKIIKWGQDGGRDGWLRAVEIGLNYISIDYGTREETQNIRLLYSRPDGETLTGIMEKFRRDTGVVPTIVG